MFLMNIFSSRPKESQLGAILSEQSKKIDFNYDFNSKLIIIQEKYKHKNIKRPKTGVDLK